MDVIPRVTSLPDLRRLAALVGLAALAYAVACNAGPRPLRAGESASSPAAGLDHDRDLARGVLTYAVAFADDDTLVSIELATSFDLVVRELIAGQAVEVLRVPLGPAEYDIDDLAIAPPTTGPRHEDAHDGKLAWVASRDGTVRAIALTSGTTRVTWHMGSGASAVAIAPDGEHIAVGTEDGIICLRRLEDGALLQCVAAHDARVSELTFDHTSKRLASASWDGWVYLWRIPALTILGSQEIAGSANGVAFDPDGHRVAIATSTRIPRRTTEIERRERRGERTADHGGNAVVIWSPGRTSEQSPARAPARAPAQASDEGIRALRGHRGPVTRVAWTPDGARLLSVSWDRTVTMWDARRDARSAIIVQVEGFSSLIRDLAIDRRGNWVAVGAWTRSLDARSSTLLHLLYPITKEPGVDD